MPTGQRGCQWRWLESARGRTARGVVRRHGRALPWRDTRDPYAILVSEVMAQQTQIERVVPRYERWLTRWPTVEALAAASAADVIVEWQGLGYNRRALNLHRAAPVVAEHRWPDDLTELPCVGPYTAAGEPAGDGEAVAALARDGLVVREGDIVVLPR